MKTIIAGTDFSASSQNACRYAAFLALKLKCKLSIFNLFEAPVIHSNMGMFGITYTSERQLHEAKARKLISELQTEFPKLKIAPFVVSGSFKEELKRFIKEHQVQAVVMGLSAKDKLSKRIWGTHGVEIAGKIKAPVIIVPDGYTDHSLDKLLLAVDNNEKLQRSSLNDLNELIKATKVRTSVIHVRTPDELVHPAILSVKVAGKNIPIELLHAKSIENGLGNYCSQHPQDMVVLISKRHSVFYNMFNESNTKRVAFTTKVPVMSLHE